MHSLKIAQLAEQAADEVSKRQRLEAQLELAQQEIARLRQQKP